MATYRFPVEPGQVLFFAGAVGDPNRIYHDEKYASSTEVGHVIAPPTFTMASYQYDPEYRLRPVQGEPWMGSGAAPTGTPGAKGIFGLYAEQHYEYHRTLRPGDVLTATSRPGETWEKQGRRGGTLHFYDVITEYRDEQGELVITSRQVVVQPERVVEG